MNRRLGFTTLTPRHVATASPAPTGSSTGPAPATGPPGPRSSATATPAATPTATSTALVFVAICDATCGGSAPDEVLAYTIGSLTPSKTITNGLANPIALGFNAASDLLVENCSISPCGAETDEGSVGMYPPEAITPQTTVTNGISVPNGLAVASDGTFAVSNCVLCDVEIQAGRHRENAGSAQDSVTVYSADGGLLATITSGIESPGNSVFDSSDTLYVPNLDSNAVTIYPENATTATRTLTSGVSGPKTVLVDPSGTVYVANETGNDVETFLAGTTTPSRTIATDPGPSSLAFGPGGVLYVATSSTSTSNGDVEVFVNFAFSRRITDGAAGDLLVANQGSNSLTEYRSGASAPFATVPLSAAPTALVLGGG